MAHRHGLGPLVLVVREHQIEAAAVKIETLAEDVKAHHHALGVPSGTSGPPWRRVLRNVGRAAGLLPQSEVDRVALVRIGLHPRARLERLDRLARQQAIVANR